MIFDRGQWSTVSIIRRLILVVGDVLYFFIVNFLLDIVATVTLEEAGIGIYTPSKVALMAFCIMGVRFLMGMYTCLWRYANAKTYLKFVFSDCLGGLVFLLLGLLIPSINMGLAYGGLGVCGVMILTLFTRLIYQYIYEHRNIYREYSDIEDRVKKYNIAIVGAGNVGASLAVELVRNPRSKYQPFCFVDVDDEKIGNDINGVRIYGECEDILERLINMPIDYIVIALPDLDVSRKKELFDFYSKTGYKVRIYDYLPQLEGGSNERKLRDFSIEDLLFRDSLKINSDATRQFYADKTILVTGGGGSIGSELCRQIAKLKPKKLVIFDIYENNAYEIQQELVRKYGDSLDLLTLIGSVRDVKRLEEVFSFVKPDLVFHAAAHKHVPLMEVSGCEAIKNNVIGTYNVANMAEKYGVKKFLLISTDKAVNPTNVMGASKRLCEMVIQCRHDSKTEFTAVRFGNVLGSNGSVIPLFKKQIAEGGPITLTDKRIIRYFMTIPEAVGLVMETCAMAHNGELYVLDMGKPVKILDLAENMVKLSGLVPYKDIDIVEIGLRPGEKLYEELLMKTEELDKTDNEMIFIERDKGLSREEVESKLNLLLDAVEKEGQDNIVAAVKATVPTFHDPAELNKKAAETSEMKNAR